LRCHAGSNSHHDQAVLCLQGTPHAIMPSHGLAARRLLGGRTISKPAEGLTGAVKHLRVGDQQEADGREGESEPRPSQIEREGEGPVARRDADKRSAEGRSSSTRSGSSKRSRRATQTSSSWLITSRYENSLGFPPATNGFPTRRALTVAHHLPPFATCVTRASRVTRHPRPCHPVTIDRRLPRSTS